jgi:P pilus assembly chaperone PapD
MITKRVMRTALAAGLLATSLFGALPTYASVVIAGTRVIYNGGEREVTVKLTNEGKSPALTQIWLDKGDPKAAPSTIDVPFVVTPPVTRIDPGKGQTLRILHAGAQLPQDKESVFWLNVLEIPPKPGADEADANRLQLAFRSRIKLFYRPQGLKGNAQEAPAQVRWKVVPAGKHPALEASNPTQYHVSFADIEVSGGGKTAKFDDGGMVGPGETKQFPLTGELAPSGELKVHYHAINDFGGPLEGDATAAP